MSIFLPCVVVLFLTVLHVRTANGFVVAGARSTTHHHDSCLPAATAVSSQPVLVVLIRPSSSTVLHAIAPRSSQTTSTTSSNGRLRSTDPQARRRRILLARRAPHFQFDRFSGNVEFGATAVLVTQLDDTPNPQGINTWLSDGRGLALSIWEERLMTDLGRSIYRLQTMKLHFVTIQLSPTVDMKMWTELEPNGKPLFSLQSQGFDPNIQLLPGLGVPADALKIEIEVVGELRPSPNGKGVEGIVTFQTQGNLPPPMRLLPDAVLQMASTTISDTVIKFASDSFQKGAKAQFRQFQQSQRQQQQ
jgi:hypothetical protein